MTAITPTKPGLKVALCMLAHWPLSSFSSQLFFCVCLFLRSFCFHFISFRFIAFHDFHSSYYSIFLFLFVLLYLCPFPFYHFHPPPPFYEKLYFFHATISMLLLQNVTIGFPVAVHLHQFVWHLKCVLAMCMCLTTINIRFFKCGRIYSAHTHTHERTRALARIWQKRKTTSKQIHKIIL